MFNKARCKKTLAGLGFFALAAIIAGIVSCGGAPTPFAVNGPGGAGNEAPTLGIRIPANDLAVAQGVSFAIEWDDQDRDDDAIISFQLIELLTNRVVILVSGIPENDSGANPDSQIVETSLVPVGSYNLIGVISDGVNPAVTTYATVGGGGTQRVVIQIVGAGEGPLTNPPTVAVIEPRFDRSVTQGDEVTILVRPTPTSTQPPQPNATPYDADSVTTIFIVLDRDQVPNNDDPFNPDPSQIIVLEQQDEVPANSANELIFPIDIDLNQIPADPDGDPYFVRASISDGQNPVVHSYASGRLSVVQLAVGTVDLFNIGRNTSGAKFQGFNAGANLGSTVKGITDFDADGVDDFIMVAQFGNPQNAGPVGEAYLLYGRNDIRYGGTISVNSIGQILQPGSDALSGVIFQAPPVRTCSSASDEDGDGDPDRCIGFFEEASTEGITDVSAVSDLTGDGRPELLFSLPHVHGAFDSTDFDLTDEDLEADAVCYNDDIVNNASDSEGRVQPFGQADFGVFGGGMGVMVNSENRANSGFLNPNRLEATSIALELVGQVLPETVGLDNNEVGGDFGFIVPRAETEDEEGRIAGARFVGGFSDWVVHDEPAREDSFATSVAAGPDLDGDGRPEIIISSPFNERFLIDLAADSKQEVSTQYEGSLTILPGGDYNDPEARSGDGTSVTPRPILLPPGGCGSGRGFEFPLDSSDVIAEDPDDALGGGKSAGDFNLDGFDDILAGAPLNDLSDSTTDTGAVYIIYGRLLVSDIFLNRLDDPDLRPPTLRIRGSHTDDILGFSQEAASDVNGDRIDDVIIASPLVDFGGITSESCDTDVDCQVDNGFVAVVFGGRTIDGDRDLSQIATTELPGVRFYGGQFDDLAGWDVASGGDFNQDGFSDILIAAPGEIRLDSAGRLRLGVVYLIFGGTHLYNTTWNLSDADRGVGSESLPGIVFLSPYVLDTPNEAPPTSVSFIGDINDDGFDDIAIGIPQADFIDLTFPQGPDAPGDDAAAGRRSDAGDVYVIYGNNFGSNR